MVDTFFDISVNTRQILAVFKAGYPEKMIATCPSYAIRLKRYSEEQQKKNCCSSRSSKVAKYGLAAFIFPGYLLQTPCQSNQYLRKYKKVIPESRDFHKHPPFLIHLTLKAPITTAADDKFCDIFPSLRQK